MRMESLQQRTEELERKEQQLKESLLKFDKFLKGKDRDIARLEAQQQELIVKRTKLQERISKYEMFATFMRKVLDSSEEFSEVREIIDRYNTLVATHEDLLDHEQYNQEESEKEKGRLVRFTEEKNNQI